MEEALKICGWRKIASDAHASQLLRRELKHHLRFQQRNMSKGIASDQWSYRDLLNIKKGNWYKFMKNKTNSNCGIIVWRMKNG